jgi:hypothetical protein
MTMSLHRALIAAALLATTLSAAARQGVSKNLKLLIEDSGYDPRKAVPAAQNNAAMPAQFEK